MSKFLVTGGAGFIGSHIAERLSELNHKVIILDNFSSGTKENMRGFLDKIVVIEGDIRNFDVVNKAVEGVDYVLHQAALRSVPKSLSNPYEYNEVNINGTLNLLRACSRAKIKRFVFASSSAIYGETEKFPERETDVPELVSPYALTKLTGEYYCRIFSKNFDLDTVSLRYFNVFGPRQAVDDEYSVVIPKFITCILNNQSPPVDSAGKQSRDFIFIDNVVQANILAATKDNLKCEVFNIGCGEAQTILNLVNMVNKITHKSIKPVFKEPRPGDVFKTLADISQAKRLLGYKPAIDFEEGLRKTILWFQKEKRF